MIFKRIFCVVLCVLVLLSSSAIACAENQLGIINGTNVRMRSAPRTSNSTVVHKFVEANQRVYILETVSGQEAEAGNGTTWYKVTTLDGLYTGYVYGVYVTLVDQQEPPQINTDFAAQLAAFPESYHSALTALHNAHPEWIFIADHVSMSFETAVASQYNDVRKMVELSQGIAWRSLQKDQYNWDNDSWKILDSGRWVAASREVIGYYMDPRNFLDETYIYMFMKQGYNSSYQTEAGLNRVISGTFLANGYTPNSQDEVDKLYGGSYTKVIMAAAEKSGVSPYVIAAKIITEQGTTGASALISGTYGSYQGYYNFLNWGASGATQEAVVANGLQKAKDEGWDSRADAIIGGAIKLADGYINAKQDTYFYMNFNLREPDKYWHQYAGSAYDAYVKASNLSKAYKGAFDGAPLVFSIPVYTSIPEQRATKADKGDNRYNNYYLTSMQVSGLSPSFNMYTYNYTLSVTGDTTVYIELPEGAALASAKANLISKGDNSVKITVKSQTGYYDSYTLNVASTVNCTLTVTVGDPPADGETPPVVIPPIEDDPPTYQKGDTNGDDKINIVDLANVQKHLLGIITLSGSNLDAADTNSDGKINIVDLANVQKHLLGIISLI